MSPNFTTEQLTTNAERQHSRRFFYISTPQQVLGRHHPFIKSLHFETEISGLERNLEGISRTPENLAKTL